MPQALAAEHPPRRRAPSRATAAGYARQVLVRLSHPYGRYGPGSVLSVPDDEAALLLDAGLAVPAPGGTVTPPPVNVASAAQVKVTAAENLAAGSLQAALNALAADADALRATLPPPAP